MIDFFIAMILNGILVLYSGPDLNPTSFGNRISPVFAWLNC